jgi:hypothetical protein
MHPDYKLDFSQLCLHQYQKLSTPTKFGQIV